MRVSPRDLKAVRSGGLVTRYAVLGDAVFAIVEVPDSGSAGTRIEDPCRQEHWALVLQGQVALEGRRPKVFESGTAFHVVPGALHRFRIGSRAVIAAFQPSAAPIDESPEAMRARGMEILRRISTPAAPPTSMRIAGSRSRVAQTGQIQTESALMGTWMFTRTTFGPLSGFADGWCDLPHWGLVLDGSLVLRWEDGDIELLGPGDAFHCPGGPTGHRIEVADVATIVDYTPIAAITDPDRRPAPRTVNALGSLTSSGGRPVTARQSRVPVLDGSTEAG